MSSNFIESTQNLRALWGLSPDVAYLNHGSFGATPLAVLEHQHSIQRNMESEPVQFMLRDVPEGLWESQKALASFVHAQPQDIVLMENATTAVNTVFASLSLEPGDEILFVDQVYGACRKTAEFYAQKWGATCRVISLPTDFTDSEEISQVIVNAWSTKTKLLLLDHICSPTGWILPIAEVVAFYEQSGVPVLVDGAHALGQIPLDIDALGASYYVANAHKWLCTPKGSAMLHVRGDRQSTMRPLVLSHWMDWENTTGLVRYSTFQMAFAWNGTRDVSALLSIPFALKWMSQVHAQGWNGLQGENTSRAKVWRRKLSSILNEPLLSPEDMVGHMGSVLLPRNIRIPKDTDIPIGQRLSPIWDFLYTNHQIEVVVFPVEDRQILRFSIQAYVTDTDMTRLVDALGLLS
jgi:isopenicillin-N epimerase